MSPPYDPNADDPDGIHAAVRDETKRSRFRDRCSRARVHPFQHDVNRLVDFVLSRRQRSAPAAFTAARRVLHHVDSEALRFLVATVLEDGSYNTTMRHRCERVVGYCETIEAALKIRDWLKEGEDGP